MRKPAAHFKPETKQPTPKKKNVVTATLCIVLALVLVMAVAVTGCNSTNAPESEASSQTSPATPTAEPTEEPTPTPTPVKAFSDGKFQISCVDFVPLYEDYLQESTPENQNLVMKRVDNSETVTFQMYKGEIDAGITMAFTLDGDPANEDEIPDSISLVCTRDSLNTSIWPVAFAVLNQTIQPDLSYMDCLKQIDAGIEEMSTSDPKFSYEIGGVTYLFQMYTDTLFSITATIRPELLEEETEFTTPNTEESGDNSENTDVSTDSPELVTDHQSFTDSYVAKLKVLEMFEGNYKLTVTETDGGLSHTFNGESTNVLLTFTADGMVLTSSSTGEVDSTAAFLAMAAIMNTITPSVGSISDCATVVQDMLGELQETGNITEEMVYHTVGNVQYGVTCPGIIVFSVVNV